MSTKSKPNEGDWVCSDVNCANVNFARRTNCNRCSKEKPTDLDSSKKQNTEIGKAAAEKSHGLFSADDWQCTKCGNVNWARRSTCNMCNAPKFGETEERTGYGGGFNERMGVEYVKREEDSDDEYDEFGRRRKKSKSASGDKISQPQEDRKASEEEEEDSDEGDLSKYEIWGDDDDDDDDLKEDKKETVNKHSKSSQHSRSSSSSSSSSCSSSSSSASSSTSRLRFVCRSNQRNEEKGRSSCSKRSRSRSYSRERKQPRR